MAQTIRNITETVFTENTAFKTRDFFSRDYTGKHSVSESKFVPAETDLTISIMDITPSLANIMLKYNVNNRPIKDNHVKKLVAEMLEGRFVFNGDAIRFSSERKLIDGQHRLIACSESGLPFTSVVIEGINQKAFSTIDSGRKREPGDVLSISGFENNKVVAAAVRLILFIESGNTALSSIKMTNAEILEWADVLNGIVEAAHFAACLKSIHVSNSVTCALYYLFSKIDNVKAKEFFVKLKNGESLSGNNPILILRNMLEYNRASNRRYSTEWIIALTIKAWNHFQRGSEVKSLRYRDDEPFPRIEKLDPA